MKYDEALLRVEKEAAHERIVERVPDLRVNATGGDIEYRTNAGILLATLSDAALPSGETGAKLRYRTVMIRPTLAHARTQAQAIRRALAEYTAD